MNSRLLLIPTKDRKRECCYCGTDNVKYLIRFFDPDTKEDITMRQERKVACCTRCAALFMNFRTI